MDKNKRQMEISNMINLLKGNRSIRKFSKDTGVSASYITGILQGKYLPSAEIIRKLSMPEANPQGGITQGKLMSIVGYTNDPAPFYCWEIPETNEYGVVIAYSIEEAKKKVCDYYNRKYNNNISVVEINAWKFKNNSKYDVFQY